MNPFNGWQESVVLVIFTTGRVNSCKLFRIDSASPKNGDWHSFLLVIGTYRSIGASLTVSGPCCFVFLLEFPFYLASSSTSVGKSGLGILNWSLTSPIDGGVIACILFKVSSFK